MRHTRLQCSGYVERRVGVNVPLLQRATDRPKTPKGGEPIESRPMVESFTVSIALAGARPHRHTVAQWAVENPGKPKPLRRTDRANRYCGPKRSTFSMTMICITPKRHWGILQQRAAPVERRPLQLVAATVKRQKLLRKALRRSDQQEGTAADLCRRCGPRVELRGAVLLNGRDGRKTPVSLNCN